MIRNPATRQLRVGIAAAFVVALVTGIWFYNAVRRQDVRAMDGRTRETLASVSIVPVRIAAAQREWVATGFSPEYLIAPPGPRPCVTNAEYYGADNPDPNVRIEELVALVEKQPTNRFPALLLATELTNAGRHAEAERITMYALANGPDVFAEGLPLLQQLTIIHLHHLRGVARLSGTTFDPPWTSLRNAIGGADLLRKKGQLGRRRGDDISRAVLIPTPNCGPPVDAGALSVEDLHNNLIVAYMRHTIRGPRDISWLNEFVRGAPAATALQRLFEGHARVETARAYPNGSQLLALSNVERIISAGLPGDARLSLNAIQVIDWWTAPKRCPSTLCTPALLDELRDLRHALLKRAIRTPNVSPPQRRAFARNVIRLLAGSPADHSIVRAASTAVRRWLPPGDAAILGRLETATAARALLPQWIVDGDDVEAKLASLGSQAKTWERAALHDFVASAATELGALPAVEQRKAVRLLYSLTSDERLRAEVEAVMRDATQADRIYLRATASRWWWIAVSILLALVIWLGQAWVLVQIWERRMLTTSLYDVELEQLRRFETR